MCLCCIAGSNYYEGTLSYSCQPYFSCWQTFRHGCKVEISLAFAQGSFAFAVFLSTGTGHEVSCPRILLAITNQNTCQDTETVSDIGGKP